jgi:hypothetical protein
MPIVVFDFATHVDRHELHSTGHVPLYPPSPNYILYTPSSIIKDYLKRDAQPGGRRFSNVIVFTKTV